MLYVPSLGGHFHSMEDNANPHQFPLHRNFWNTGLPPVQNTHHHQNNSSSLVKGKCNQSGKQKVAYFYEPKT